MPPQRILAPYKLFNLFCGNHLYFVVCSLSFCRVRGHAPAPGYRHRGTGVLGGVGSYGYSWSSAFGNTDGMRLFFYVTGLNPSYASNRATGYQLRCLSE